MAETIELHVNCVWPVPQMWDTAGRRPICIRTVRRDRLQKQIAAFPQGALNLLLGQPDSQGLVSEEMARAGRTDVRFAAISNVMPLDVATFGFVPGAAGEIPAIVVGYHEQKAVVLTLDAVEEVDATLLRVVEKDDIWIRQFHELSTALRFYHRLGSRESESYIEATFGFSS